MSMRARDTGYAPTRWEFDSEVTRVFSDMLSRSIPQYETMRHAVNALALDHMRADGAVVYDLGCSRGDALAGLRERASHAGCSRASFVGLETSLPMLQASLSRFALDEDVAIFDRDVVGGLDAVESSSVDVVLAVLTLQFVPAHARLGVLRDARRVLRPGGALVVVEKLLAPDDARQAAYVREYHAFKRAQGYSAEEIETKARALTGVLVPRSADWLVARIRRAGLVHVDAFWRWMNFGGFIAVKP